MKKLTSILLFAIVVLCSGSTFADPIIDKIESAGKNRAKITGQFVETKKNADGKIAATKKGTLTFTSATKKLDMLYTSPNGDKFSISGDQLTIVKSGKTSNFNLTKNMAMKSLSDMLSNAFAGKINNIVADNNASASSSSDANNYIVTLTSKKKEVRGYSKIILTYDKVKMELKKMQLNEWSGKITTYELK